MIRILRNARPRPATRRAPAKRKPNPRWRDEIEQEATYLMWEGQIRSATLRTVKAAIRSAPTKAAAKAVLAKAVRTHARDQRSMRKASRVRRVANPWKKRTVKRARTNRRSWR
jgi:hypothetical protein